MTGFYMTAGYGGCYSAIECEENLRDVAERIRATPAAIVGEVVRLEPRRYDLSVLKEIAERYPTGEDQTVAINDVPLEDHPDEVEVVVVQYASGGGRYRDAKEAMRRAYCRLVVEEMAKSGFNVNVQVS